MNIDIATTQGTMPANAEQGFVVAGAICQNQTDAHHCWENEHLIVAEKLLAEVEMIQREIKQIRIDMMLLNAMEEALDAVSQNLAEIRRLVRELEMTPSGDPERANILDRISDLQTVLMLIEEETEFNGIRLFEEGAVRLASCEYDDFFLKTSQLPQIAITDDADLLERFSEASADINARYDNINYLKRSLQDIFSGLRAQIETLFDKRC